MLTFTVAIDHADDADINVILEAAIPALVEEDAIDRSSYPGFFDASTITRTYSRPKPITFEERWAEWVAFCERPDRDCTEEDRARWLAKWTAFEGSRT